MYKKVFLLIFFIGQSFLSFSQVDTLTFDVSKRYQTIEGFGGAMYYTAPSLVNHPNKQKIYDYLFKDLGTTILRVCNKYPGGKNSYLDAETSIALEANKRTPTDIMVSAWSPPAAYKSNHDISNHGTQASLDTNAQGQFVYGPYAKWWYNSVLEFQKKGVPIKYLSIQNEPNWPADYDACVFRPTEQMVYDDSLKKNVKVASYATAFSNVYDTIFKYKDSIALMPKMIGPELIGIHRWYGPYMTDYTNKMDMSKCYGIAHHLYTGGSTSYANQFISNLSYLKQYYSSKPRFQTEYSEGNWFFTAQLIHNSLLVEQASGYVLWTYAWNNNGSSLIDYDTGTDTTKWRNKNGYIVTKKYFAVKQFSNFIKPGWQMIDITPSDTLIQASAFISPDSSQVAVVIVNNSKRQIKVNLNPKGFSIAKGDIYLTNSTYNCSLAGSFNAKQNILPVSSIVTYLLTRTPPLAIKDINFKATKAGNNVLCSWQDDSKEVNKFELQKSFDGTTFSTISTINSTNIKNFYFVDSSNSQNISTVYYRLRIIEKSSQIDYSNVSSVRFETPKRNIVVYPNPIHSTIFLSGLGLSKVIVTDALGRIVFSKLTNSASSKNSFTPNLSKGVYFLKMFLDNGETNSEKIIFQP